MKKILCVLLVGTLLLLAGCKSEKDSDANVSDSGSGTVNQETPAPDNGNDNPDNTPDNAPDDGGSTGGAVTMIDAFGNNPSIVTSEYTVTDPTEGMSNDEMRQLMIDNSLMTLGDTARMTNVLKKAAAGEEITVGYIGGSITEGIGVPDANSCWAKLSHSALCEMYPDTKINFVNAGLSGTNSTLGIARAERDLYSEYTPDIVFIEFAVNNGGEQMDKDSYESLVRKVLEKDNDPAVVLLFTVLKNEYSCQPWMTMVGEYYGLPMISVGNAINPMFHAGLMEWEKYSDDESHPNAWGHALVSDFVKNYFEQVKEIADAGNTDGIAALPSEALYSIAYKDMQLLERSRLNAEIIDGFKESDSVITSFSDGWRYSAKGGAAIKFTAEFKTLFLVFHCNNADGFADAQVYIDGELVNSVSSNRPGGWGNPEAYIAWSTEDAAASHEVEIRVAESDSRMYYGLCGVGIC